MTFRKKSLPILLVLSIAFCATAYAAPVTSTNKSSALTIPLLQPGVEISFTALLLKPNANNLDYALFGTQIPLSPTNSQEQKIKPGYAFGFDLGGRYILQEGNDFNFNWTHLNSSTTDSTTADASSQFVGPTFDWGIDAGTLRSVSATATFKYDVVNIGAGQYLDFGKQLRVRLLGGLSTAFLREDVNITFNGLVPTSGPYTGPYPGAYTADYDYSSNFTGVGPRVGIGATYNTASGFGFLGEAAASVLAGFSHTSLDAFTVSPFLQNSGYPNGDSQSIKDNHIIQVVPGFDGKLGINYKYAFSQHTLLTIEGGYQGAVYINAVNQYTPATIVATTDSLDQGLYVATMNHTQSNYVVHGPFLKLALLF